VSGRNILAASKSNFSLLLTTEERVAERKTSHVSGQSFFVGGGGVRLFVYTAMNWIP